MSILDINPSWKAAKKNKCDALKFLSKISHETNEILIKQCVFSSLDVTAAVKQQAMPSMVKST
jgi:hypothetical protein